MHTRSRAAGLVVMGVLALATSTQAQSFDVLFRVAGIKGNCQIKKPGAVTFEPALNGKAYPFGTIVRTGKDGEAVILLSIDDFLKVSPQGELSVSVPEGTPINSNRTVHLEEGKIDISVREGLADKALVIETAAASCDSFTGRSTMELIKHRKPAKDQLDLRLQVHTDTGTLRVFGPQFAIPKMRAASAVRIESSASRSITKITNESNEYAVNIDNGTDTPVPLETSALSAIRICREPATVGGKLVVSVLETAPNGQGKGNFAFVLGDPSLTSSGMPTVAEEHSATGTVATATVVVATTNAPAAATAPAAAAKEESTLTK